MDAVTIDAGTLEFSDEDLTATGLLVPYGVKARSNLGEFEVGTGAFSIPTDLTGSGLNIEHKRESVVGGLTKVWEQSEGLLGMFKFAATDAGRKAFAEAKSGKRRHLSAEVASVRIRAGKAISGLVFGAALVERPAFQGATLLAAEDTTDEFTDTEGVKWRRVDTTDTPAIVENTADTDTPESAPDEDTTEEEATMTASAVTEPGQQAPAVPATLLAGAAPKGAAPDKQTDKDIDLGSIFASMAAVKAGTNPDAETLLATISDIKAEASGGLTVANSGITQPAWVGRLWQGRRYQRKYLDLLTHLYGGIQLGGRKGFKLNQGTALVTAWSGNKTEIGSGTASTSLTSSTRQAYGYAADVAREWYDLEGGADVIQAFFEGVVDSYAKVTDLAALTTIFDVASKTSVALDRLVDPDADYESSDFPDAVAQIIQGIELVSDADDDATFAIVNPVAWKQLLATPFEKRPEYVQLAVGVGTGEGSADSGKVLVRKAPQSYFTGLDVTEPATIVGAKPAIEFREQGQTPIQIDALDIAKGGVDKAVIGYLETFKVRPESLVLIGTEEA